MTLSEFETVFNDCAMPTFEDLHGVSVYLQRGPLKTTTFIARRQRREHTAMGAALGIDVKTERREYLLPVSSVVFGGQEIEPRAGDRLFEGTDCWIVHFPDDATPAAERLSGGYDWAVHVKKDS